MLQHRHSKSAKKRVRSHSVLTPQGSEPYTVPGGPCSTLTRDNQGSWKHAPEKLGTLSRLQTSEPAC